MKSLLLFLSALCFTASTLAAQPQYSVPASPVVHDASGRVTELTKNGVTYHFLYSESGMLVGLNDSLGNIYGTAKVDAIIAKQMEFLATIPNAQRLQLMKEYEAEVGLVIPGFRAPSVLPSLIERKDFWADISCVEGCDAIADGAAVACALLVEAPPAAAACLAGVVIAKYACHASCSISPPSGGFTFGPGGGNPPPAGTGLYDDNGDLIWTPGTPPPRNSF